MFDQLIQGKNVALEEDNADGQFHTEIEHVFYGRLTDFNQLNQASKKIYQEQWEIKLPYLPGKNAASGRVRVRKVIEATEAAKYYLTTKIDLNATGDKSEVTTDATMDQFVQFKFLSPGGMIKDRYEFTTDSGLVWEVDCFINPAGGYYEWCKIDLEVPNRETPIPDFPIDFAEIISGTHGERSDSDNARIRELYEKFFIAKNKYVTPAQVAAAPEPAAQPA